MEEDGTRRVPKVLTPYTSAIASIIEASNANT